MPSLGLLVPYGLLLAGSGASDWLSLHSNKIGV